MHERIGHNYIGHNAVGHNYITKHDWTEDHTCSPLARRTKIRTRRRGVTSLRGRPQAAAAGAMAEAEAWAEAGVEAGAETPPLLERRRPLHLLALLALLPLTFSRRRTAGKRSD